jgi:hypothetical protein
MTENAGTYSAIGPLPKTYIAITLAIVAFSSMFGIVITISPLKGALLGLAIAFPIIFIFRRSYLMFYAMYLPFEELFLKYAPDQIYPFFRYGGEAVIVLLFFTLVIKNFLEGKGWRRTPIDVPILLLVCAVAASTIVNSVPVVVAASGVKNLFRYIFLFFIITQSDFSKKDIRLFLKIFIISGILQITLGLIQIAGGDYVYDFFKPKDVIVGDQILRIQESTLSKDVLRISGTLIRPGIFGNYIAMVLCALLARKYVIKNEDPKAIILLLVGAITLVASFSRKGWVSIFLAYIFMNMAIGKKTKAALIIGISIIILVFLISGYGFVGSLSGVTTNNPAERLVEMFSPDYLSHSLQRTRLYIIFYITYRIATGYFWFGFGPGLIGSDVTGTAAGTSALFNIDRVSELDFADERLLLLTDVGFANIFAQIGFFGILAFLIILGRLLSYSKALFHHGDRHVKMLSLMFIGFMMIMIVENIFGSAFTYRAVSFYFWLFAGLMFAACDGSKNRVSYEKALK